VNFVIIFIIVPMSLAQLVGTLHNLCRGGVWTSDTPLLHIYLCEL